MNFQNPWLLTVIAVLSLKSSNRLVIRRLGHEIGDKNGAWELIRIKLIMIFESKQWLKSAYFEINK